MNVDANDDGNDLVGFLFAILFFTRSCHDCLQHSPQLQPGESVYLEVPPPDDLSDIWILMSNTWWFCPTPGKRTSTRRPARTHSPFENYNDEGGFEN